MISRHIHFFEENLNKNEYWSENDIFPRFSTQMISRCTRRPSNSSIIASRWFVLRWERLLLTSTKWTMSPCWGSLSTRQPYPTLPTWYGSLATTSWRLTRAWEMMQSKFLILSAKDLKALKGSLFYGWGGKKTLCKHFINDWTAKMHFLSPFVPWFLNLNLPIQDANN